MIFSESSNNTLFEKSGYLQCNFLSKEEVDYLINVYNNYAQMEGGAVDFAKNLGYYISVFDSNPEKRKYINDELKKVFTKKVENLLVDYKILYGNFMCKEPGGKEIEVHQDFSFVDEKKYTAFNLWVPLQYTNATNGGFHLIESSNKLFTSYRSSTIPYNLTHFNESFKKLMKPIEVKAGDGLIFDHKLFHYSTPNQTSSVRIAVQMVLIPKEATPCMYYYDPKKDDKNLEVYEMTEQFLLTKNLWTNPTSELNKIGTTPYIKIPDAKSILKKLNPNTSNSNPFKIIKNFLKHV